MTDDLRQVSLVAKGLFGKDGMLYPTIAWRTAMLVSPGLEDDPLAISHTRDGKPLFSTLLQPDDFRPVVLASEIAVPRERQKPPETRLMQRLRGRIAVIGSVEETKLPSNIGDVYGHLLQASYLEAILDGRLWRHLSPWIEIPVGVLFWFGVEFPAIRWHNPKSKLQLAGLSLV